MAAEETLGYDVLFNTSSAEKSGKRLNNVFAGIGGGVKAVGSGLSSLIGPLAAIAGAGALFGAMKNVMPGISIALEVMGRTLVNNLIAPLAREVMPLLIQMVAWFRDNRTNFVQFGQVLANAFRVVLSVGTTVVKLLGKLFGAFFSRIGSLGQVTVGNFTNFLNFMLLKISFVINFVLITIEPLIEAIGSLFGTLWSEILSPFISGFTSGFSGDVGGAIQTVVGMLTEMVQGFQSLFEGAAPVLRIIGNMIGRHISDRFQRVAAIFKVIFGWAKTFFKGFMSGLKEAMGKKGTDGLVRAFDLLSDLSKFLFFKLLIPALQAVTPAFRALAYVIGYTLGSAISGIASLVRGLVRVFDFFVRDVPNAFRKIQTLFDGLSGGKIKKGAFDLFNSGLRVTIGWLQKLADLIEQKVLGSVERLKQGFSKIKGFFGFGPETVPSPGGAGGPAVIPTGNGGVKTIQTIYEDNRQQSVNVNGSTNPGVDATNISRAQQADGFRELRRKSQLGRDGGP